MPITYVERFCNGSWLQLPSVQINDTTTVVTGGWLKTASIDAEECAERELASPSAYIESLKQCRSQGLPVDIFTFAQMLPNTEKRYDYPAEPESVAAIRLTTYSDWWDRLPQESRKNVRRAAKRGVEIRTQTLNDDIVRGIVDINNETPVRQGRPRRW
jgi:hypothetical protein